ncbi:MAG TPA: hypothetical protein PKE45_07740, partial [Caldilineaceae bacterium]|nr:hypothetical protein [Caldilineaceae bacterium]
MMLTNSSRRTAPHLRRSTIATDIARRPAWFFVLCFVVMGGLSLLVKPGISWANFGTVPPGSNPPPTVLVGPVTDVKLDATPRTITVAGILITLEDDTRIDERVGPLQNGVWARVEGNGDGDSNDNGTIPDATAGLTAVRIKVLPPMPLVRLTGPLDDLKPRNENGVGTLKVDGIGLFHTITTMIVGDPQPKVDRVSVRAA